MCCNFCGKELGEDKHFVRVLKREWPSCLLCTQKLNSLAVKRKSATTVRQYVTYFNHVNSLSKDLIVVILESELAKHQDCLWIVGRLRVPLLGEVVGSLSGAACVALLKHLPQTVLNAASPEALVAMDALLEKRAEDEA